MHFDPSVTHELNEVLFIVENGRSGFYEEYVGPRFEPFRLRVLVISVEGRNVFIRIPQNLSTSQRPIVVPCSRLQMPAYPAAAP